MDNLVLWRNYLVPIKANITLLMMPPLSTTPSAPTSTKSTFSMMYLRNKVIMIFLVYMYMKMWEENDVMSPVKKLNKQRVGLV